MQPEIPDRVGPQVASEPPAWTRMLGAGLIAAGILIIAVLGVDWSAWFGPRHPADVSSGIAVGQRAPDFEAASLDGGLMSLSDLSGKVVLLNFWATWCSPCRVEMPFLQAQHEAYPAELAIVGVNFDEPRQLVLNFAEEFGLTFEMVLDPGGLIQDQYEIRGYPTSYFLDREGVIRVVHIGVMSEAQLDGYLRDLGLE